MNKNSKYTQKHKEPTKNITINLPIAYIEAIEGVESNRSEFLRKSIRAFTKNIKDFEINYEGNQIVTVNIYESDIQLIDNLTKKHRFFSRSEFARFAVREGLIEALYPTNANIKEPQWEEIEDLPIVNGKKVEIIREA